MTKALLALMRDSSDISWQDALVHDSRMKAESSETIQQHDTPRDHCRSVFIRPKSSVHLSRSQQASQVRGSALRKICASNRGRSVGRKCKVRPNVVVAEFVIHDQCLMMEYSTAPRNQATIRSEAVLLFVLITLTILSCCSAHKAHRILLDGQNESPRSRLEGQEFYSIHNLRHSLPIRPMQSPSSYPSRLIPIRHKNSKPNSYFNNYYYSSGLNQFDSPSRAFSDRHRKSQYHYDPRSLDEHPIAHEDIQQHDLEKVLEVLDEIEKSLPKSLRQKRNTNDDGVRIKHRQKKMTLIPTASSSDTEIPIDFRKWQATLWTYLRGSYPSLASYLLSASMARETKLAFGEQNLHLRDNFRAMRLTQAAMSINKLLTEADQLARDELSLDGIEKIISKESLNGVVTNTSEISSSPNQQTNSRQFGPLNNQNWLPRLLANPLLAKIYRHLQSQRHKQQPVSTIASNSNDSNVEAEDQSVSSSTDQARPYGRVVHYPQDLSGVNPVASYLEKLRFLRQHQQRLPHESNSLDSNRNLEDSKGREHNELRSDQFDAANFNKNYNLENDQARGRFTYGDVVDEPNGGQTLSDGAGLPAVGGIETLRQMEQKNHRDLHLVTDSKSEPRVSSRDSYGHVILKPTSKPHRQPKTSTNHNEDDKDGERTIWGDTSKYHAEGHNDDVDRGGSLDEFAFESDADKIATSTRDEFEGIWHSGPLQQVSVHSFRSTSTPSELSDNNLDGITSSQSNEDKTEKAQATTYAPIQRLNEFFVD